MSKAQRIEELTKEYETFINMLVKGYSAARIGAKLFKSKRTVEGWIVELRKEHNAENIQNLTYIMAKKGLVILFLFLSLFTKAQNVMGGLMNYNVVAHTPPLDSVIRVRVRLVVDSPWLVPAVIQISVWDNDTGFRIFRRIQGVDDYYFLPIDSLPCAISSTGHSIKYVVVGYYATFNLYINNTGFYASTSGCCRASDFTNVAPGQGWTYFVQIPSLLFPDNNPDFGL